jgi:hypothetical protein
MSSQKVTETTDAISRVKRGLAAYISYLAACDMNKSFSEYVLYEPILRILTAQGYKVECEYECPGISQPSNGDKKKLDFYARKQGSAFALEVKWAKNTRPILVRDVEKLRAVLSSEPKTRPLLCIFGRRSDIESLDLNIGTHKERGRMICADFGRTRFGCRIFQLTDA